MPYIKQGMRKALADGNAVSTVGELTYALQQELQRYLRVRGESYQTYAEILGALRGVEIDLVERKLKPYEVKKLAENGDVWD